ncbi:hypothetical protein NM208_g13159 [Fusarium decemcellulare]|uniref:Uncharacterized protein n=1 Tax=Fusarium decemcellulare TaxID=57161 RepID=A0ACC1RKX4_9HYPO|nr:hypothetical protein NM208_g13159 [Fusarium decemcellulare]
MPSATHKNPPSKRAPLCRTHFENYARKHVEADFKQKKVKGREEEEYYPPTPMNGAPIRVQPRRAAKDKYFQARDILQKRRAEEELLYAPEKRKRMEEQDTEWADTWAKFEGSLERQIRRAVRRAEKTEIHDCPFGPLPLICDLCITEIARLDAALVANGPSLDRQPREGYTEVGTIGEAAEVIPFTEQSCTKDTEVGGTTEAVHSSAVTSHKIMAFHALLLVHLESSGPAPDREAPRYLDPISYHTSPFSGGPSRAAQVAA